MNAHRTLPLTAKQERVWRYIRSCERSPTYREMERDLNASRGKLSDCIATLREKGFVSYQPHRARTLVAIDPRGDLSSFPTEALEAELARRSRE